MWTKDCAAVTYSRSFFGQERVAGLAFILSGLDGVIHCLTQRPRNKNVRLAAQVGTDDPRKNRIHSNRQVLAAVARRTVHNRKRKCRRHRALFRNAETRIADR